MVSASSVGVGHLQLNVIRAAGCKLYLAKKTLKTQVEAMYSLQHKFLRLQPCPTYHPQQLNDDHQTSQNDGNRQITEQDKTTDFLEDGQQILNGAKSLMAYGDQYQMYERLTNESL